jgi:hypothetical protein
MTTHEKITKHTIPTDAIPHGFYCYDIKSITLTDKGHRINTIPCPYYKHINGIIGMCSFLDVEIDDQCKLCSINENIR